MRSLAVLITASVMLAACPRPQCPEVGSFRCNGEIAEICDSAGRWSLLADCEKVSEQSEGTWECVMGICERTGE